MSFKFVVSVLLLSSLILNAAPKNIGIRPEKVQTETVEGFKDINQAPGLSEFNSKKYIPKLPVVENNLNCDSPEVKELVGNKLYQDYNVLTGDYKTLKKNANITYCSCSYRYGSGSKTKYFWVFRENGQVDVKKFELGSLNCDDPKILEYFKKIAAGRNIKIQEYKDIQENKYINNYELRCSMTYKTSDLQDSAKLYYNVGRDEDYEITLETTTNGFL